MAERHAPFPEGLYLAFSGWVERWGDLDQMVCRGVDPAIHYHFPHARNWPLRGGKFLVPLEHPHCARSKQKYCWIFCQFKWCFTPSAFYFQSYVPGRFRPAKRWMCRRLNNGASPHLISKIHWLLGSCLCLFAGLESDSIPALTVIKHTPNIDYDFYRVVFCGNIRQSAQTPASNTVRTGARGAVVEGG